MLQNSATNRQRRKYQWTAEWSELEGWYKQLRDRSSSSWCDNLTKKNATAISKWLLNRGLSQRFFASKVLNRSQGSFSDYLPKAPSEMPKTHGRAVWLTLDAFLKSSTQQEELVSEFKRGNYHLVNFLWLPLTFIEFLTSGSSANSANYITKCVVANMGKWFE